ncbi:MAG: BA14K family protein [Bradyrhizobium sp.]|nr:BA14K family protein [Bradyrhizobium sp.]
MTKLKLLGAAAILSATIASPVLAQEGAMGPGPGYGQPAPTYYNHGYRNHRGYWDQDGNYRDDNGFAPLDAAAGVVNGAVNTAGAIATAPFRAMDGDRSYAMMQGDASYCAQRYRSYDPQSGTFMGYDGRRHPCQ